jgi:hypothetical protein
MALTKRLWYWNAKGKRVRVDPSRSRLMTQVMKHRKGKKLSAAVKQKISKALKKTYKSRRTKTGRTLRHRRKTA